MKNSVLDDLLCIIKDDLYEYIPEIIEKDNNDLMEYILKKNIVEIDYILSLAIRFNKIEIVKICLCEGAAKSLRNSFKDENYSSLIDAIEYKNIESFRLLIEVYYEMVNEKPEKK